MAKRSRGTPRIANRILRRVRDFAEANSSKIDRQLADKSLNILNIDDIGLDEIDKLYLKVLIEKFAGGPVGLSNMATAVSEEKITLETMVEPFLIKQGLLIKTLRGRKATSLAYKHLKITQSDDLIFN